MGRPGASVLSLWLFFGRAAAGGLHEPEICYILDGILFLYGLVLTTLYCRLKIVSCRKSSTEKQQKSTEEGIYARVTQPADVYDTIIHKT